MAAYAALVSVMHVIDNLRLHCRPPISLHKEQAHLLSQKVTFLQKFLEIYDPNLDYSKEADPFESRIARAAYAAEDAIESHIFDQLTNNGEEMSSDGLHEALEKVLEEMALIEKEAMEIKETGGFQIQLRQHTKSTPPNSAGSSFSSIEQEKSTMVGADGMLLEMKSKLTTDARDLQTIPVVGMGGSGKTTLALNIYQDRLIEEHFDVRAWVTISQEYSIRQILVQLVTQLIRKPNEELSEGELGLMLHKHLYFNRFIIILDDVWSVEAWDGVMKFLPNSKKGSRIVITTRLTALASTLSNSNSFGMKLLNEDDSWDLLSKTVFRGKVCPPGFEEIGKKIGQSCKGLPLSIVVVGGLLAKSEQTIEFWEHMKENLNTIVNLDDDQRCLKILYMSYKQLPIHLKPCFLYMGIYREDYLICISDLIKLWVAEGFLKPVSGKRPEDVARAYLKDLIDINLILVHRSGSIGSIKYCKVHDLLRDLCLREAQKQGFYTVYSGHVIEKRVVSRIVMPGTIPLSSTRSLILDLGRSFLPPHMLRLVRIVGSYNIENVDKFVNSRFFTFTVRLQTELPSSIWQFWNLQTLIVTKYIERINAPNDIWYMSHIRHLDIDDLYLPDPPPYVQANGIVLENLQSLGNVHDFKCSEQMVKTIPNVRKLRLTYDGGDDERFCLTNLDCLDKLESLHCTFKQSMMWRMNYPQSLKKLSLQVHRSQCWQDTLDKIGALPLLEKLMLYGGTFKGQWETREGQFRSLKFLILKSCGGLQVWTSEASHFPRLEQLHLHLLSDLEEIPIDFAEVSTLRLIRVFFCRDSAILSANRIWEEQEALYGDDETTLQIRIQLSRDNDPAILEDAKKENAESV